MLFLVQIPPKIHDTYIVTSAMVLTLHLLNLNGQNFQMAAKSRFEALNPKSASLKKGHLRKRWSSGRLSSLCRQRKNSNRNTQTLKTV